MTQFAFIASRPEPVSAFWASLGWPEFSYTEVVSRDPVYRGKPGVFGMRLGWQRHGPVPFEWIQPLKGPSAYHDYLGKFGEGFHHLAFNVADMDRAIEEWRGLGYEMTMAGA
ncbi:MAG TPA: VOC family protein, partial [Bryobacteraceae bacterium]|nr:VOC family protein [Bryobacteraceae bacterium]